MAERDARERFARAVEEGATHSDDEELGTELGIVTELRRAGQVPLSDDRTRHNVAVRIAGQIARPAGAESEESRSTVRRPRRGYLRPALVAAFCLFMGLGGLALLFSKGTLPGDGLYPLKRARESTVLALTFDHQEQATRRLTYASDRLHELSLLAGHEAGTGKHSADYSEGFAEFDSAAQAGSRALTSMAVNTDGDQLDALRSWAARESEQLAELTSALPAGATEQRAEAATLLRRIEHRAGSLHARFDCYRITSGSSDELGAVPATGRCVPPANTNDPDPLSPNPRPAHPNPSRDKRADPPSAPPESHTAEPTPDTAVAERVSVPDKTRSRNATEFDPVTSAPAPQLPERPRLPDNVEEKLPGDGLVPEVVDGILNIRLS